jgi:RNA-directed DNA polymerase
MAAEQYPAGAVSRANTQWHDIDWRAAQESVRRLQARIVKATKESRWGKVKALQRLLTHSFYGKAIAVERVTQNHGKNTAGVDKIVWSTPQSKSMAIHSLKRRGYKPLPLKRVYIPKSNGSKLRPLGIPCMKDRAMQALYLLALDPIAECQADPNSYGFRKERACADAIEACFKALRRSTAANWILEGDIKSCFDRISHEWLLAHIPMDRAILRKWLKAGYIEKYALHPTPEGSPQGGIISPVIANLTLDGLERELRKEFPLTFEQSKDKVYWSRYADDFVITGKSKQLLEERVRPLVQRFLEERGLELSPEKTTVTSIENGFDFLGQTLRKYGKGRVLLIRPSKKNIKTFLDTVRIVVKENASATAGNLIAILNPKIRGWANYHRHVVSKQVFSDVDHAIFACLWRWARRRHPGKRLTWIKDKYFGIQGGNRWVFFGEVKYKEAPRRIHLARASEVAIRRHVKIRGAANPYDPDWELYFEQRLGVKMANNLKGRRSLSRLWKEQGGLCPICDQPITQLTGWHSHHIVWRVRGGSDGAWNRVLLHPNCHRQVHSRGLCVTKPRLATGVEKA